MPVLLVKFAPCQILTLWKHVGYACSPYLHRTARHTVIKSCNCFLNNFYENDISSTRHFTTSRLKEEVKNSQGIVQTSSVIGNSNNIGVKNSKTTSQNQNSKKTRTPKINSEIVEILKKADENYNQRRSSFQAIFPFPKNNLHNAFAIISSQLGTKYSVEYEYKRICQAPMCWESTANISWPREAHFTCQAASKSEAANRASLITLQWLQSIGKINQKGEVELMVQMNKKAEKNTPIAEISLGSKTLTSIENIVNKYYEEVSKVHLGTLTNQNIEEVSVNATMSPLLSDSDDEADLEVESLPLQREKTLFPYVAERRDRELFSRYERIKERRNGFSTALPIDSYKEEIIELINENRVVVIKGEPGCGKSTQVPQYIMEWFTSRQAATDCNVVVTQPRRISAMALADRVAYERNEQVGDVTGYHVRLNAKHPRYRDGFILFCSTGLLVRKMISDPALTGVSHVIVDEAHERDTQLDFLLLLLKRALTTNSSLKVIIMSATINAQLFTQYFDDCPSISIPGFTYPVEHHFLDDQLKQMLQRRGAKFEPDAVNNPSVNLEAVLGMVTWLDETKPEGAILVFLPGWLEIRSVMEQMAALPNAERFMVVPAHSKLSSDDQRRIFITPNDGRRKVILATNIAETSLTINDFVYVVDTGTVKEERVDLKTSLVCLDIYWASQASVRQRRGRAGRVKPGESYHLFSQTKYDQLETFPLPEVHRIPLTRVVLDVKMYTKDEDISEFLSHLPEPPSGEAISQAVKVLQGMGALDNDEDLTALGRRIYRLPLDPHLSKALVHACLFRCVSPILSIVTLLSAEASVFENTLGNRAAARQLKQQYSPSSDHIATARLYDQWRALMWGDPTEAVEHCRTLGLVHRALDRSRQLRALHDELLKASKLITQKENTEDSLSTCNKFSPYDELLKGILLSGLGRILISKHGTRKRGLITRTLEGSPAVLSSESVNSKFKELPTPFLTYFKSMSSLERRAIIVHETSLLSPVSVVLFLPAVMTLKKMDDLNHEKSVISVETPKQPINIVIDQKEGEQLLHLRQVVWNVFDYLVENEGEPKDVEQYEAVCQYRDKLVQVLAELTSEQGANIDYTDTGDLRTEPSAYLRGCKVDRV